MASSRAVMAFSMLFFAIEAVSDMAQLTTLWMQREHATFVLRLLINLLPGIATLILFYLPRHHRPVPSWARSTAIALRQSWLPDGIAALRCPSYTTMHPFCLQPGVLAFDAATKGLAQLLYTTQHLSLDSPSLADIAALLTAIASIAWAVSSFDAGAFKHRQVWLPVTSNRHQLTRLVLLRMAELLLLVTTLTILTHVTTKAAAVAIYLTYSALALALSTPHPSSLRPYLEWLPVATVLYLDLRSPSKTVLLPWPYFRAKVLLAVITAALALLFAPSALLLVLTTHAGAILLLLLLFPTVLATAWTHKQPPARRAVRSLADCSPRQAVAASTIDLSKRVLDELTTSGVFNRRQRAQQPRAVAASSAHPLAGAGPAGAGPAGHLASSFIHDTSAIVDSDDDDNHDNHDNHDSHDNQDNQDNHRSSGSHVFSPRRTLSFGQTESPAETDAILVPAPRLRAWMQAQPHSLRLLAAAGRALKPTVRSSSASPAAAPGPGLAARRTTAFPTASTPVRTWSVAVDERAVGLDTSLFGGRSIQPQLAFAA